jgi:hypothetical protein
MGLFTRRKSSIQSFGSPPSERKPYDTKAPQLHPLPGEGGFLFDFPPGPTIPLNDGTSRAINTTARKPSRRLTKKKRPGTAQSDTSFLPRLTPKPPTKKSERPPSAASRVFVTNGQPISSSGNVLIGTRNRTDANAISLPNDISTMSLRSISSVRSLKVKPVDLLKPNPRLKYLTPDPPPPPTAQSNELEFRHDGRGLFALKTVANLADELDTRGLRKLLDRDMRRYQSNYELRKQYYRQQIPGEIPQSRGNMTISTDGYEGSFRQRYNPFTDPEPSTPTRPFHGRSDRSNSMDSRRFDSSQAYRMPDEEHTSAGQSDKNTREKHNLPPILLFGKPRKMENVEPTPLDSNTSPIILLAPNSAKSTETQSTTPRSPEAAAFQVLSQPNHNPSQPLRPPIFSFPTEITPLAQETEYETAEEFGSETPRDLSDHEHEWNDQPVLPSELTPKASGQRLSNQDPWLAYTTSLGPSDTESSNAIDFPDDEDDEAIFQPHAVWAENLGRESPVESEGSWLSGRMDIERAVRKSFNSISPRGTPPIILESSPLSQVAGNSPLKINTIMAAVAANAQAWSSASKPDHEGIEYESSDDESGIREKVRQGSAARRVEVMDSPSIEEMMGEVIEESVERNSKGEIILF